MTRRITLTEREQMIIRRTLSYIARKAPGGVVGNEAGKLVLDIGVTEISDLLNTKFLGIIEGSEHGRASTKVVA